MARFAIGITVPLLLVTSLMSVLHYYRELELFENQLHFASVRTAEMLTNSLRHAMMANNSEMVYGILNQVSQDESLSAIEIIDLSGIVQVAVPESRVGQIRSKRGNGCVECHRYEAADRPQLTYLRAAPQTVRVAVPIVREPECMSCHDSGEAHLGVLLVDMSMAEVDEHLRRDLGIEFLLSLSSIALVLLIMYLLLNQLLVKRMKGLRRPLKHYAEGNFSARMPVAPGPPNTLDELAIAFNKMIDQLEAHTKEQEERTQLREQAIIEERERIARELHDGFAQLLGYVNTKAMAVRLMLEKDQPKLAEKHLLQLEEAARHMFTDVREAILGLRLTNACCEDFFDQIRLFTEEYTRLNGIPVTYAVAPNVIPAPQVLDGETQLQLMRIVQEALANIRKHALATRVWVTFQRRRNQVVLSIKDNGVGFDSTAVQIERAHFGLSIMQERAEAFGATFKLTSSPGKGTLIQVTLNGGPS